MSQFTIDFFELSFLAEACIPPVPIARHTFWMDLIDRHFHVMSIGERSRLYEWITTKNFRFNLENEDCKLFALRFNPDNQYKVTISHNGTVETKDTFKIGDKYHVSISSWIQDKYITNVEKQEQNKLSTFNKKLVTELNYKPKSKKA